MRVSLSGAYGTYTSSYDSFGSSFGLDFYLYKRDNFAVWTRSEAGYLYYSETSEFGTYEDMTFAYGVYVGAQYRNSPNGLGVMVELGPTTYHNVSVGLALPIVTRTK